MEKLFRRRKKKNKIHQQSTSFDQISALLKQQMNKLEIIAQDNQSNQNGNQIQEINVDQEVIEADENIIDNIGIVDNTDNTDNADNADNTDNADNADNTDNTDNTDNVEQAEINAAIEAVAKAEQNICRICHESDEDEKFVSPCQCSGSSKYIHTSCLNTWRQHVKSSISDHTRCGTCNSKYQIKNSAGSWKRLFTGLFLGFMFIFLDCTNYALGYRINYKLLDHQETFCMSFLIFHGLLWFLVYSSFKQRCGFLLTKKHPLSYWKYIINQNRNDLDIKYFTGFYAIEQVVLWLFIVSVIQFVSYNLIAILCYGFYIITYLVTMMSGNVEYESYIRNIIFFNSSGGVEIFKIAIHVITIMTFSSMLIIKTIWTCLNLVDYLRYCQKKYDQDISLHEYQ